jgi:hypothetical protein
MKRILILFLALTLAACAAPPAPTQQPTAAPPEPTQTAAVIVQTVVVTVVPTNVPAELPSATPLPPPTEAPAATATQPPPATEAVAVPAEGTGGSIMVDDALGAGYFVSLTRDRNDFSLRCQLNKAITLTVKPNTTDITQVDLYYRIEDRTTGAVFDWQNAGRMIPDVNGNYVMVFTGDKVNPNFRKPNAWFDYQYIGSNATGVVGRSEKIEKQVAYTFDCP